MELRRRMSWVVATWLGGTAVGYFFNKSIINLLLNPLDGQSLIYTSPAGGFDFIFKICLFFGFLLSIPVLVYHIIKFIEPIISRQSFRFVGLLLLGSAVLTLTGAAFAYFISLPAALHFLTQFSTEQIQALLTTNEYVSFVMIYIVGFALFFQIPLLLLFINRITPLKPGKLMRYQRGVAVGSFVLGALITPTPDPINQSLMALPIIFLYQGGIGAVWLANRRQAESSPGLPAAAEPQPVADGSYQMEPPTATSRASRPRPAASAGSPQTGPQHPLILDLSQPAAQSPPSLLVSPSNILDLRR